MNIINKYIDSDNMSDFSDSSSSEYNELSPELEENICAEHKFNSSWDIWYHHQKNNWKINGYKKIFTIDNIQNFWNFNNNFDLIGGINSQHYFMMRDNITPM